MLIVIAQLKAVQGKGDELEKEFSNIIPKVREESGTLTYIVHRALDDAHKFFVYEKYLEKEAFNYHASTPYFKEFFTAVSGILDGRADISFYREIEWREDIVFYKSLITFFARLTFFVFVAISSVLQ